MDPTLERSILDLRADMDEPSLAAFEADLRVAFSLPTPRRDSALELLVRSWRSRRELEAAPGAPSWLR